MTLEPVVNLLIIQSTPGIPEKEGEEVIVSGPICPICNKAFATKNVI